MPVWRLQTSIWQDSTLPRDAFIMTPHFNDHGATTNPQNLCTDLAAALNTWIGVPTQINVKAYDAQGTIPVFPQGDAMLNPGVARTSFVPREVACCLSFYSDRNRPRQRGRLFVPFALMTAASSTPLRPAATTRQKVADLAPILAGLGGVDVDWSVYSRTDKVARKVSNWWVDDEWDTVRRRGLRPTTRLEGTTSG